MPRSILTGSSSPNRQGAREARPSSRGHSVGLAPSSAAPAAVWSKSRAIGSQLIIGSRGAAVYIGTSRSSPRRTEGMTLRLSRALFFETRPNLGPRCLKKSLRPAFRARRIQVGSVKRLKSWNFWRYQDFTKSCRNRVKIFNFCSDSRSHRQYYTIFLHRQTR
jgi:hypothetical protein